jgi:hypothetical protein
MQVAREMGRAVTRIERNSEGPGLVGEVHPEQPSGFGITQPVALFAVEPSVPL